MYHHPTHVVDNINPCNSVSASFIIPCILSLHCLVFFICHHYNALKAQSLPPPLPLPSREKMLGFPNTPPDPSYLIGVGFCGSIGAHPSHLLPLFLVPQAVRSTVYILSLVTHSLFILFLHFNPPSTFLGRRLFPASHGGFIPTANSLFSRP
ncbi:hypothetical protein BGW80DRAFT_30254 [Lactifluus volemus]|nr:hypothetical protein BGW80DRAFT_30254 [Lactifluus volemus]